MNKKKVTIVVVLVVIVLVTVIGGIVVYRKSKSKPETPEPAKVVQESEIKNVKNFVGELDDGTKINTNAKFNSPSTFENFSIDNIRLTLKNGITTFRATVTNNGSTQTELKEVTLVLLNENSEEIATAKGIINMSAPGSSQEIVISITSDYINACGYKIK